MGPGTGLGLLAASGLVNFLLKTMAEFLVCLLLVRIAGSAKTRFNLWLTMLLAFVAQWVWMLAGIWRAAFPASGGVSGAVASLPASAGERIAIAAPTAGMVSLVVAALLVCYVAVVVWRTMGTLAARVRLTRAMRYKSAPAGRLAAMFEEVVDKAASLGCELRDCELWVLPGLTSPATLGWLRPRVIVPPACETQDVEELEAVFWHELKHVERRDALWNGIMRTCRDLLWFHPAVHRAAEAMRAQRELACDAAVVREHPQSRDVYASCLLRFARMSDLAPEPAIPAIEMASSAALLTMRVRSILNDGPRASRFGRLARTAANVALVGLMAATVPGLNILFAAEQGNAALRLPSAADGTSGFRVREKKHLVVPANAASESASQPAGSAAETAGPVAFVSRQDDGLAAEHRAAMDVLTESTGMDAATQAGENGTDPDLVAGAERRSAKQTTTSWGAVALDAAQQLAPLMNDHDADDRH